MSNVTIAVGTTLEIVAGAPATYDDTGYAALTYVKVGEVTGIGTFGGSSTVVTNIPLETGEVDKHIGSTDFGTMTLALAEDTTDAGQEDLQDGYTGANRGLEHAIKLTVPTAGGSTAVRYTSGKISEYTTSIEGADSIISNSCSIALTKAVISG